MKFSKLVIATYIMCGSAALNNLHAQAQLNTAAKDFKFIDPSNMDKSVKPGDNFFEYANGTWLQKTEIPGDKTRWGSFDELRDRTNKAVQNLLESVKNNTTAVKGSKEYNVSAFYNSGMNTQAINKLGIKAIDPQLKAIQAVKTPAQLLDLVTSLNRKGIPTIINGYIGPDDKDVTKIITQFGQGGLGLPSKDYYTDKDENAAKNRTAYIKYITDILIASGQNKVDAAKNAAAVFALENKLADASFFPAEMRDPQKMYNKFSIEAFSKETPNINWADLFNKLGIHGEKEMLVSNPGYYKALSKELTATPIATWKQYMLFHTISHMSPYLSEQFENLSFEFYGKTMSGQKEQTPRWERVMGVINGNIGDQLGQLYVDKNFKPEAKEKMLELVNNLQVAFGERIQQLDWMSPVTKEKAMTKLNSFMKKIGYPDKWKDYSSLVITKDNYAQNVLNAAAFNYNEELKKLGKAVDRMEWFMTPNTVNAYYNPAFNEIVFPAAILQYPFFDFNADDAINYGGIGAVIGHEMTHGFDDQGAQYAADGNLRNWWTPEDEEKFKAKTQVVVNQFNNYRVLDTVPVNGELTLGENIADLGGLAIAYQAFKKTEQGQSNEMIDGFTPDQRFFLSWAQIWRGKATDKRTLQLIKIDPHSPGVWRAIGPLSNFEPFYKAFNIQPGDKMYRPENERAKIW